MLLLILGLLIFLGAHSVAIAAPAWRDAQVAARGEKSWKALHGAVSLAGFALGWAVQLAIAAFAYRLTRARQMVRQYPWLYRRKGLLGWEERH